MCPGAVYAQKHSVGDAGPAGVFSRAIETNLVCWNGAKSLKNGENVLFAGLCHGPGCLQTLFKVAYVSFPQ